MKKTICLVMILCVCIISLSACTSAKNDPIELAILFEEEDYAVKISIDDEDINEMADDFEIRSKDIYCVVVVVPNNGTNYKKLGTYIYCNSASAAKEMKTDLEDYLDGLEEDDGIDRCIVEASGKMVFLGCEDTWEASK